MDILEFFHKSSDTLLVSFGGHFEDRRLGGFVFVNFLQQRFPHVDQLFLMDTHCSCYHKGVGGVSTNIDETVAFLQGKIHGYDRVLFIGNSGGGYAALLFGALLHVHRVVAFVPPTLLMSPGFEDRYRDVVPFVEAATQTKFVVYGDCSITDETHPHHIRHCNRLPQNVTVVRRQGIDLRKIRDSGELLEIVSDIICS